MKREFTKRHTSSAAVLPIQSNRKEEDNAGALPPLVSLKCHLCEGYFRDPVTLPCLHSFCRECLEKYNSDRMDGDEMHDHSIHPKGKAPGTGIESKELKEEEDEYLTVHCPTCIEQLGLLPPLEPQVPFENSRLKRIVGMVLETNIVCQNCAALQSEVKCKVCSAWLCLGCWDTTHSAKIFKSHEKEPLSHSEMFALPKCDAHPTNDLEFFSTEEEIGVCQVCLLKGDFVGKPYCLVSDVRSARQIEIEKAVKVVLDEKERLLEGKQKMNNVLIALDRELEAKVRAVKENFHLIRAALDKREGEALHALNELKETKAAVLKQQMAQAEHVLTTVNDGISNVDLILTHSNDLELVYLTIVLQEFVADLAKIDAPKFGFKYNDANMLDFFHNPSVDSELPVLISSKVADLVAAYAPVPAATFEPVVTKAKGANSAETGVNRGKLRLEQPKVTQEQKEILKEIGVTQNPDESGCAVQ